MSARWTFSPEVLAKARTYIDNGRVTHDPAHDSVWWIKGSGPSMYRVQTDTDAATRRLTWASCTCPHGKNVGAGTARCSHVVAVLITIRDSATD